MSAFPPKADIPERDVHVRFVPKADSRTAANFVSTRGGEQRLWDAETERLGGLEVDHEFKLGRQLYGNEFAKKKEAPTPFRGNVEA
jgi:hypothetical protein